MKKSLLLIYMLLMCYVGFSQEKERYRNALGKLSNSKMRYTYDTLNGSFYFERFIKSYHQNDVYTSFNGFVKSGKVDVKNYQQGYFVLNQSLLENFKRSNPTFNYDSISVAELSKTLFWSRHHWSEFDSTDIMPYCGLYYQEYKLRIEVIKIGETAHIIPIFLDCKRYDDYVKRHHGVNYQIKKTPVYLITNVFEAH